MDENDKEFFKFIKNLCPGATKIGKLCDLAHTSYIENLVVQVGEFPHCDFLSIPSFLVEQSDKMKSLLICPATFDDLIPKRVIFRRHIPAFVSGVDVSETVRTFDSKEVLVEYLTKIYKDGEVKKEDIILDQEIFQSCDPIFNWRKTKKVLLKRFGAEDYMEMFGTPQCFGFYSEDFEE